MLRGNIKNERVQQGDPFKMVKSGVNDISEQCVKPRMGKKDVVQQGELWDRCDKDDEQIQGVQLKLKTEYKMLQGVRLRRVSDDHAQAERIQESDHIEKVQSNDKNNTTPTTTLLQPPSPPNHRPQPHIGQVVQVKTASIRGIIRDLVLPVRVGTDLGRLREPTTTTPLIKSPSHHQPTTTKS